MKKEKKTKQKKTKKYKIWFVIMVVPILLSVLPINTYAVNTVSITTDYIDSIGLAVNDNNNTTYSYAEFDRISTTEITTTVSGTKYGIALYYITRPNYKNITHVTASFEIRNTESGSPVKRLSSITPILKTSYNQSYHNYNLNIITYVNRYKYTIDTDIVDDQGLLYFYFNIESHDGNIEINYIDIQITYDTVETTETETENEQLSNIESILEGLVDTKGPDITKENLTTLRIYGIRNNPNNNPTWYNVSYLTDENGYIYYESLYTQYRQVLRFALEENINIKSIQVSVKFSQKSNSSGNYIAPTTSDYPIYISYFNGIQTEQGDNPSINHRRISRPHNIEEYYYNNANVNVNTSSIIIYTNLNGLSNYTYIEDISIIINDVEYEIKASAENAENAVSEYESYINSLYPDESELQSIADVPQDIIENIEQYSPGNYGEQYSWFTINVFNTSDFLIMMLLISTSFMLIGFIFFGKAR